MDCVVEFLSAKEALSHIEGKLIKDSYKPGQILLIELDAFGLYVQMIMQQDFAYF
jgi:hypothetical protein